MSDQFYHIYHDVAAKKAIVRFFDVDANSSLWGFDVLDETADLFGRPVAEIDDGIYSVDEIEKPDGEVPAGNEPEPVNGGSGAAEKVE